MVYSAYERCSRLLIIILIAVLSLANSAECKIDSSFGKTGAKIGQSLKIRLPNQYAVRSGQTAQIQSTAEQSETLVMSTQKGVDVDFSSVDLTLSLDDFGTRVLEPMMAVLATVIEADAFSMFKQVYQLAGSAGVPPADIATFLNAKTLLNRSLAPKDSQRNVQVNSATSASMVGGLKTLYQDDVSLSKQYLEGRMYRTSGMDFFENENIPTQVNGLWTGSPVVYGAGQNGSTLITNGWTASVDQITAGTVFTVPGCYMVHPETKVTYGALQQFVCTQTMTADATGAIVIPISPSIVLLGNGVLVNPYCNVTASPTNGGSLTIIGTTGGSYAQNIAYHKDAFAFVTADMFIPPKKDAYRTQYDGISMRVISDYDIVNDLYITRFDVLYGYLCIRPQLACRVTS